MHHLIVSREFPPASYAQGGIGTYAAHMARLLAEAGETVHVIGERWSGAPDARQVLCDNRLIVHRVPLNAPLPGPEEATDRRILRAMLGSSFPAQTFSWQVARFAESLIQDVPIDCIEGQDYEAPLYYFLLRRALGLGPERKPPCFVHLHSPTQVICHFNDWDIGRPDHLTAKRLEDYVIHAADAALCPSRYLARQVERHYGLGEGSVEQIPLPRGDTPFIERTAATWASGTICYVGRMEPRKGVFEWIDAAVRMARERPGLQFELIGADTSPANAWPGSVRAALLDRVPRDLRSVISFVDAMPRQELRHRLARARIAVVPSRWENYPNTCVEAMATGLPVLATPHGGMIEMVQDGLNGWVAADASVDALAATLRCALEAAPERLAEMGQRAAADIRRLCDNASTVERHQAFRARVASMGAIRSTKVPTQRSSTVLFGRGTDSPAIGHARADAGTGLSVLVEMASPGEADDVIADLRAQTQVPTAVVIDAPGFSEAEYQDVERRLAEARIPIASRHADQRREGLQRALTVPSRGVAIRPSGCRFASRFLEVGNAVLARHQDVGIVSHWYRSGSGPDRDRVPQIPARPYQWVLDDLSPCAVFRTSAALSAGPTPPSGGRILASDLALAILCDGWEGMTVPEFLSSRERSRTFQEHAIEHAASAQFRNLVRDRWPSAEARDSEDVLAIVRGVLMPLNNVHSLGGVLRLPLADQLRIARRALEKPGVVLAWLKLRKR